MTRGRVLDLQAVLVGEGERHRRTAACEGVEHDGGGEIGVALLAGALARVARPRLVDRVQAVNAGLCELHGVLAVAVVVDAGGKREAAGALVVDRVAGKGVAQRQGLILGQLAVELEVLFGIAARGEDRLGDREHLQIVVERRALTKEFSVHLRTSKSAKKDVFLPIGPPTSPSRPETLPVWLDGRERIARVEDVAAVVGLNLAVEVVAAGLGEDLDSAHADAVVLRGEGILVDADFADRGLGGQAAAGEAIDVDLAAVGSGAGTGESGKIGRQIVGIVGRARPGLCRASPARRHWRKDRRPLGC